MVRPRRSMTRSRTRPQASPRSVVTFDGNYAIYYPPHFFLLLAVVALMPIRRELSRLGRADAVVLCLRHQPHHRSIRPVSSSHARFPLCWPMQSPDRTDVSRRRCSAARCWRWNAGQSWRLSVRAAELQAAIRNSHSAGADLRRAVARVRVGGRIHTVCSCLCPERFLEQACGRNFLKRSSAPTATRSVAGYTGLSKHPEPVCARARARRRVCNWRGSCKGLRWR